MPNRDNVFPKTESILLIAGNCNPRKTLPTNLKTKVAQTSPKVICAIPVKLGTSVALTFSRLKRLASPIPTIRQIAVGVISAKRAKKVVETAWRARVQSLRAAYSANLLRSPLPNPISKESIQSRMELSVIQMPYSYGVRHASVSGTMRS